MIVNQDRPIGAPPHGVIFAAVVVIIVLVPFLLGDGGEAVTDAITELLSPIGLLLLPVVLLLTIQFLSSDHGGSIFAGIFTACEPYRCKTLGLIPSLIRALIKAEAAPPL